MATTAGLVVLVACGLLFCTSEALFQSNNDNWNGFRFRRSLTDASSGSSVFDVTTFGAKGDGKTDDTQSIMKAWGATCKASAPSKLVIPSGKYLTGPTVFQGPCSNTPTVQIEGDIIATEDISQYSSDEWVLFEYVDGLTVNGGGTFQGQGATVWKYNNCKSNSKCKLLPTSLKFHQVKNGLIHGINSIDAKSFHMAVNQCENITFDNLHITAPDESPNTDGIHISKSSYINITNSNIGTGDDCISIGQGALQISISKVFCGPGHGISVGSLGKYADEEDVSGIRVSNCTLTGTTNGARIKTWPGSPASRCSDIVYEDIIMNSVQNPIIIDQNYGNKGAAPSKVKITNAHFTNIRGTSAVDVAVSLHCSSAAPCEGVELLDINLVPAGSVSGSGSDNALGTANAKEGQGDGSSLKAECENVKGRAGGTQNPAACL